MNDVATRIRKVVALDPDAGAVDFHGNWTTWGDLAAAMKAINAILTEAGISTTLPIGWIATKRPSAVAAFAALLASGRPIAPVRANTTSEQFLDEIRSLKLAAIIGDGEAWLRDGVVEAAREAGSMGIAFMNEGALEPELVKGLEAPSDSGHKTAPEGMIVERLSSGTTGPPKRIPVTNRVLGQALKSADAASGGGAGELALKRSPAIIMSPFTHAGGIFGVLFALYQARPIVLIDKFEVDEWSSIMRTHRPKSASLVPAMLRMILDADVPADVLSSLKAVRSGTAPLDPDTQIAFEERYGIPVLIDYGATEFIGGVAGWSLADHSAFARSKRGSVGRPRPDVSIRSVDPDTGATLAPDEIGLLEIKSPRFGPDWNRTNDLASVDEDGFLYIHGRADDVINRGGFKIMPDEVIAKIRTFPGVRDAALVGKPDPRLGETPVAFIETENGEPLDTGRLIEFLKPKLPAYQRPTDYQYVTELPRTNTMKVQVKTLRKMLEDLTTTTGNT